MSILKTKKLTVRRPSGYVNNKGKLELQSESTFDIDCTLQIATPEAMQKETSGRVSEHGYKIYTNTILKTSRESESGADIIEINGLDYQVESVSRWENGLLNNVKVAVSKK